MEKINFFKMSGSGNDFIVIDNRKGVVEEKNLKTFISKICRRRMSVGADGIILLENAEGVDFKWRYYNADGGRAEMCGNGARCVSRFAWLNRIAGYRMSFETDAGIIDAEVVDDQVMIKIPDPAGLKLNDSLKMNTGSLTISGVNTGVPHVVVEVDDIEEAQVVEVGRQIRYHEAFAPEGTNVNFVSYDKDGNLAVRTYERGVEDETLACGTGAIAGAVIMACKSKSTSPIKIQTRSGGFLTVHFKMEEDHFFDVSLQGDARIIYRGELCEEAIE
ncbi:MAG: diaminopimelate epimerase [Desulfobacterales bacterium]|nr:diaminopimelate epimerase [Desulfobacterales bacterium]